MCLCWGQLGKFSCTDVHFSSCLFQFIPWGCLWLAAIASMYVQWEQCLIRYRIYIFWSDIVGYTWCLSHRSKVLGLHWLESSDSQILPGHMLTFGLCRCARGLTWNTQWPRSFPYGHRVSWGEKWPFLGLLAGGAQLQMEDFCESISELLWVYYCGWVWEAASTGRWVEIRLLGEGPTMNQGWILALLEKMAKWSLIQTSQDFVQVFYVSFI